MEEKIYYAKDQLTALEQIKTELGPDAVIVRSRRVMERSGFLGLFKKPMYEVVVSFTPEDVQKAKESATKQATVEGRAASLFSDLDERARRSRQEKPQEQAAHKPQEQVSPRPQQQAAQRPQQQAVQRPQQQPAPKPQQVSPKPPHIVQEKPAQAVIPAKEEAAHRIQPAVFPSVQPAPAAESKKPAIAKEQFADIIGKAADELYAKDTYHAPAAEAPVMPAHVSREAKLNAYRGMTAPLSDRLEALADQLPAATVELENRPEPKNPAPAPKPVAAKTSTAPAKPQELKPAPKMPEEEPFVNQRVAALEQAATAKKRGRGRPRKNEQYTEPHDRMESLESSVASLSKDMQLLRETLLATAAATAAPAGPMPNQAAPLVRRTAVEREMDALGERLIQQDVDTAVVKKLVYAALGYMQSGYDVPQEAMNAAIRDVIGKPKFIRASTKATRSVILFGPTGVGKTTTLAKLAAQNVLEREASVALVNADVFRVGAQEQLSVYADILKIPVRTIYKAEDIRTVLDEFSGKNFVFIDTCGKPTQDPEYQAEIQKLVNYGDVQDKYLVISSTSSARVIREIVESFRYISSYKLIVTKLDESGSYGAIVNLCSYSGQPIAYLANGQNVPDDIVRADVDEIIQRLWR